MAKFDIHPGFVLAYEMKFQEFSAKAQKIQNEVYTEFMNWTRDNILSRSDIPAEAYTHPSATLTSDNEAHTLSLTVDDSALSSAPVVAEEIPAPIEDVPALIETPTAVEEPFVEPGEPVESEQEKTQETNPTE